MTERQGPHAAGAGTDTVPAAPTAHRAGGIDPPDPRMRAIAAGSVDEWDIAVALEVEGLSDAVAARRFGVADVHEFARQLRAEVPVHVAGQPPPPRGREGVALGSRLAARGLLYTAPGLYFLTIGPDAGTAATTVFMVAVIALAWTLGQVLAVAAQRLLTRTGIDNTARVLRRVVVCAVAAAAGTFAAAYRFTGYRTAVVLAALLLYLVAATVLILRQADRTLALILLPGTMLILAAVAVPAPGLPGWAVPAVAVATAAAAAAAAAGPPVRGSADHRLPNRRSPIRRPPIRRPPIRRPQRQDLAAAVPYAVYGLLCAAAVSFLPLAGLVARSRPQSPLLGLAVLPMALVMGYAELQIRRLRRLGAHAAGAVTLRAFRRSVVRHLAGAGLRLVVAMSALAAGICAALWAAGRLDRAAVIDAVAYVALGTALIAGLVTSAFAHVRAAITAMAIAYAAIALGYAGWPAPPLDDPAGHLAACLLLAVVLGATAVTVLRNPGTVVT